MSEPLLGRPFPETLELYRRDLLAFAADRFSGSVNAKSLTSSFVAERVGRIAHIVKGIFREDGRQEADEDTKGSEKWCDIGTETNKEWEELLAVKLSKTR